MENIIDNIKQRFDVSEVKKQINTLVFLTLSKEQTIPAITYLRDYEGFSHFVLLSAVDWLENSQFQLTYLLHNHEIKTDIAVKCFISREKPGMESAHHLWEQIATYQREIFEMYGIVFPGSPRLEDPLLLEGWDNIPPMRREFDTKKYSEETFFPRPGRKTNDPAGHMKKKLYPGEGL